MSKSLVAKKKREIPSGIYLEHPVLYLITYMF